MSRKWRAKSGSAVMWSTGMVKKPWIWPACRSIVSRRSAPALWIMSASKRLEIGSRRMREWVRVSPGPDWGALAREALTYVRR